MRLTLGRCGRLAVVAALVLLTAAAASAQTPLNYVYMPEIDAANGELLAYPVYIQNGLPVDFVCVPLAFEPGTWVRIDSVSTAGSRIEGLGVVTSGFLLSSRKFFIDFDANPGTPLPAGDGLLGTVYIMIGQNAPTHDIAVDSTFIGPNLTYMMLDDLGNPIDDKFDRGTIHVITQRPMISLDPATIEFSAYVDENPPAQVLNITNLGVDPLEWTITHAPSWMGLSATSGTAPSAVTMTVDVTGMVIGEYNDSIVVFDDFADPKFVVAPVHLEITERPDFETRCIALHQGWNLISWNLDTPNDDVETLIANIKGCIYGIYGFEEGAGTYDPELPQFSTLTQMDHLHGYWFRMECDTVLCIEGVKAAPGTPIDLEANWNLVSYLPDNDDAPEIELQSMIDVLVVALGFDNGGQSYDPANPELATLELMKRDFGYWLKTTASATLTYPGMLPRVWANPFLQSFKAAPMSATVLPTREWVNLYGDGLTIDGQMLAAGSVVEVFDESGVLCGTALVERNGRLNFTPIYIDDKSTDLDEGADYGGMVSVSINGEPAQEAFGVPGFGEKIRANEFTSLLRLNDGLPRNFALEQNYPNPFNPTTMIEFSMPVSTHAKVEVFNLLGERVNVLIDRYLPAGNYSVTWRGDDQLGHTASSGIYFYRLSAGDFTVTRKMMLVK